MGHDLGVDAGALELTAHVAGHHVRQLAEVLVLDEVFLQQPSRRVGQLGDGILHLAKLAALQGVGELAQVRAHRGAGVGGVVRHHVVEVEGHAHGGSPSFILVFFGHKISLVSVVVILIHYRQLLRKIPSFFGRKV